jgi:hypothetical protein
MLTLFEFITDSHTRRGIFIEILRHLSPRDIMRMRQTCKGIKHRISKVIKHLTVKDQYRLDVEEDLYSEYILINGYIILQGLQIKFYNGELSRLMDKHEDNILPHICDSGDYTGQRVRYKCVKDRKNGDCYSFLSDGKLAIHEYYRGGILEYRDIHTPNGTVVPVIRMVNGQATYI